MTNGHYGITDQVKKYGVRLVFLFSVTKIPLASSEMREWKSGSSVSLAVERRVDDSDATAILITGHLNHL